jgi:hypothetical protein
MNKSRALQKTKEVQRHPQADTRLYHICFSQLTGQIHNPEKSGACFYESVSFKVLFWFFGLTRE